MMVRVVITLEQVLAQSPSEAAAFWLVRQDIGESAEDDLVFQQWLEAESAHGEAWARACSLWEGVAEADGSDLAGLREPAPSRTWWRDWRTAAAASVAALAIGCGAIFWGHGSVQRTGSQIASRSEVGLPVQKFATATGDRRVFTLADKSVVTLNTNSAVSVRFAPSERRVILERGQAYFEVAHAAARPFIVQNDGLTVTAVGTRFEVQEASKSTRVILVDGHVRVIAPLSGKTEAIDLSPGQQLVANHSEVKVGTANVAGVADWQNGLVSFHNTPLAEAILELNRYTAGKKLLIRDPKVAMMRISGSFHTNDLRRFARTIAEIYPVRIVETASAVEIVSSERTHR
ncbi:FecR family protein [Sphingomonas glacialis]|uniref:DUF4974 domain-containing protein n=1 Tax=Sphingomonas glacialis TaxID=658225 RepID=A0A502FT13_9SPHN|nr:FecR domain-containing protein [Sphingomonas glacialis]TPG52615.1 DUF4974 domain-containing protein [Sphingomonas glacialis]